MRLRSPSTRRSIHLLQLLALLFAVQPAIAQTLATQPEISVAALSTDGPYEVRSYTDFPDVPEFLAGTIYYPANAPGPVGGVAIAPGFTEVQRNIEWWGPRLASHGFAVLILDTNDRREQPDARAAALIAAVGVLQGENTRAGSPLAGRIDTSKMAIMGHSMGGGGTLLAANQLGGRIKAAIPFTPWLRETPESFSGITVPTLIMAGSADNIAPAANHAWPQFQAIPASTPKVYLEVAGGDHNIANSNGADLATMGRYGIAWLKLYLDGDERYRPFIYGEYQRADSEKFSRYVVSPSPGANR